MNSTISNYAQVKENIGLHLAMDHIGLVLVQRARKWDRDHKQIQITALEIVSDQLCKLKTATGSGSECNTKAMVLLETHEESCYSEKHNVSAGLIVPLG